MRWFEVKPGVVVHTANAWEEDDVVALLASRSKTAGIISAGTQAGDNLSETQGLLSE